MQLNSQAFLYKSNGEIVPVSPLNKKSFLYFQVQQTNVIKIFASAQATGSNKGPMLKNFLAMIGATVDWFPDRTDRKSATRNTLLPAVIVIDF